MHFFVYSLAVSQFGSDGKMAFGFDATNGH
jgi:hypothetical protein